MRPLLAVLLACLSLGTGLGAARAQPHATDPSELETEARARFQLGQLYYSQARFAEAAQEFEAAYATHPHPLLLHNIYLARRDLGDIPGAVDALRRYLAVATDLSAADRRLLEGRLATMERQLPASTSTSTETSTSTSTPTETSTSTSAPTETSTSTSTPTETSTTTSTAETESGDGGDPHHLVTPERSGGMGIVPGVVVESVGGAALIGAAIAGGVALSIQSDRDGQCTLAGGACPASLDQNDYASRFATARDAAWGLFIVGAATAVVGGVLFGVGATESSEPAPRVSAACDATGCIAFVRGVL